MRVLPKSSQTFRLSHNSINNLWNMWMEEQRGTLFGSMIAQNKGI